mgnify:CR=1 FL=1
MGGDDFSAEGESQPGSLRSLGLPADAIERFEDKGKLVRRDAGAGIGDACADIVIVRTGCNGDFSARGRVFYRITDEVGEDAH